MPNDVIGRKSSYEDFGRRHLTVTQPERAAPFARLYTYPDGKALRGGADYQALKYLASALKFNFSVVGSVDGQWGGLVDKEANAFNRMIGMVQRKENDQLRLP